MFFCASLGGKFQILDLKPVEGYAEPVEVDAA